MPSGAGVEAGRRDAARPALRGPLARQDAGIHRGGPAARGARDWREHGHVQPARRGAVAHAARTRSRTARVPGSPPRARRRWIQEVLRHLLSADERVQGTRSAARRCDHVLYQATRGDDRRAPRAGQCPRGRRELLHDARCRRGRGPADSAGRWSGCAGGRAQPRLPAASLRGRSGARFVDHDRRHPTHHRRHHAFELLRRDAWIRVRSVDGLAGAGSRDTARRAVRSARATPRVGARASEARRQRGRRFTIADEAPAPDARGREDSGDRPGHHRCAPHRRAVGQPRHRCPPAAGIETAGRAHGPRRAGSVADLRERREPAAGTRRVTPA